SQTCSLVTTRREAGQSSFLFEHTIASASGSPAPDMDFDVAIDANDTATIVDAEAAGSFMQKAIFATRWASGANPGAHTQISSLGQGPQPGASGPLVVAGAAGQATAAWVESTPGVGSVLSSAEFAGGKWTAEQSVSSTSANVAAGAFALAVDRLGTAATVWVDKPTAPPGQTSTGTAYGSVRATGKVWAVPVKLSGATADSIP